MITISFFPFDRKLITLVTREGSKIAPCAILQKHIESMPHFQEFEKNREQIFQNFKDIKALQKAVDKAKDFARWSIQPDIRKWTYDNVMNNYTEAPCPRCLDSEVKDHLNAIDGMIVCGGCFFDNPEYRLALNVEEMKDVRTDMDVSTLSTRILTGLIKIADVFPTSCGLGKKLHDRKGAAHTTPSV